ncbi:MAG TPA: ring-cleaving dioxygenase [Candidatus Sulfomarinibacteraceae bacterium]|nr:ring-cleaving dioxygenase [Candidatus Sulfomarinibacteraceae bacterium]
MSAPILGLHHVTAIAGEPQTNVDFYTGVLGLRLIKRTVNFDDPKTYHLYYGDGVGTPGTILTFFPWPGVRRGVIGTGQTFTTAFAVPEQSIGFWRQHLEASLVRAHEIERFGVPGLAFADPDGLRLELVASRPENDGRKPWGGSAVPLEHAIHGFDGVTLLHADSSATERLLEGAMGFRKVAEDDRRVRYESGDGGSGTLVDLLRDPGAGTGRVAGGSVHHVAFRVADDRAETQWQERLSSAGHPTTEVKDRMYFHSIYFREPGGVLFELATDTPGFAIDESVDALGTSLRLPPWYESARDRIEEALPPIDGPERRKSDEAA